MDTRNVAVMLLATTAFQPLSEMSLSGAGNWPPALFTSPSMRPPLQSITPAMAAFTSSSRRRSAEKMKVSGSPSSSFTRSSFSIVRPTSATRAPSDFSSWAVQRPRPEPPPVTMMVLAVEQAGPEYGVVTHAGGHRLLDLDVGGLHDLGPLGHLGAQEGGEFVGRRADRVGAEVGELRLHLFGAA